MTRAGLHWIDISIIVFYLLILGGIGFYFSRRQTSLKDFIRGGGRLGWLALGMSLMAALNSGLDYVQTPAVVFGIGMVFIMAFLSWIFLYPWVTRVTVPLYRRLDVYSAYEYLEHRFGLGVRMIGAGIFILWRVGWMGAALYVPCLAVKAATGDQLNTTPMIVTLGTVVTLYTMLGGFRGVIWTEVTQFCIMLGGLGATLFVIVSQIPGGVGEIIRTTNDAGRLDLIGITTTDGGLWDQWTHFMTTEVTVVGIVLSVLLGRAAAFTADQVAIQRFQSSRSLGDAKRSFLVNAISDTIWMVFLGLVGLALFAYFTHFTFPADMQNDRVLPYFIRHHFPVGLTGLVIAAIFAASLSSVDAALNSTTSVIMVDFYNRLWSKRPRPLEDADAMEQRRQLRITRMVNLGLGVGMIIIATNVEHMGELYAAGNKIIGAFFGPLFGIFFLGMFSRRSHGTGVAVGALLGLFSSCFASFFSELSWLQAICGRLFGDGFVYFFNNLSWQWPSPIGVSVTLVVGYVASRLIRGGSERGLAFTFREVMKRPAADAEHGTQL